MRGQPTPAFGYNLATGEHRVWRTMGEAAAEIGTKSQYLTAIIRKKKPFKGWCIAADEATAKLMYDTGGKVKLAADKPDVKLVQLRIDSHTVIWVRPEEANEKFAQKYRRKLERGNRYD